MRFRLCLPLLGAAACSSLGSDYWTTDVTLPIVIDMNVPPSESCSAATAYVDFPTETALGMTIRNTSGQPLGISFEAAEAATDSVNVTADGMNAAAGGSTAGAGGTLDVYVKVITFCDDDFPAGGTYDKPLFMRTIDEGGDAIESVLMPVVVKLTRDPDGGAASGG